MDYIHLIALLIAIIAGFVVTLHHMFDLYEHEFLNFRIKGREKRLVMAMGTLVLSSVFFIIISGCIALLN